MSGDDDDDEVMLPDSWTYHFHDPGDRDWTFKSYVRLADVSSVSDFWRVQAAVQRRIEHGSFFVMRENVFPCWDDPANINGGCISLKVSKSDVAAFWEALAIRTLGENLLPSEKIVNGISTSPKLHNCIVKIWIAGGRATADALLNGDALSGLPLPFDYSGQAIYTSSLEMIRSDGTGRA